MKEKGKKESREDRAKCKGLRLRVNRAKKILRVTDFSSFIVPKSADAAFTYIWNQS